MWPDTAVVGLDGPPEPDPGLWVPNSPAQNTRLRGRQEHGPVGVYRHCLSVALDIRGPVELDLLQAAVDQVVARHEALRAVFPPEGSAHHLQPHCRVPVERQLISGPNPEARWSAARERAQLSAAEPFDLAHGPLIRARLLSSDRQRHLLVLAFEPLVIDAWSAAIVVDELLGALRELAERGETAGTEAPSYAAVRVELEQWRSGPGGLAALERRALAAVGAPPELRVGPEPDGTEADGLAHAEVELTDEAAATVAQRAAQLRLSPFAVALTAFDLAARAWTGQQRCAVTSTFACRESTREEYVVGPLANQVLLTIAPGEGTLAEQIGQMGRELRRQLADQRVLREDVEAREPSCRPDPRRVSVSLMFLPAALSGAAQARMHVGETRVGRGAVSVCPTGADVDLFVAERPPLLDAGRRPLLALGGLSPRHRVGHAQLREILDRWRRAFALLAESDWERTRCRDAVAALDGKE